MPALRQLDPAEIKALQASAISGDGIFQTVHDRSNTMTSTPPETPRPGTFTAKTGIGGTQPHLLLVAANGEPIVWSETYTSPDGVRQALEVVVRTVLAATNTVLYGLATENDDAESHEEAVTASLEVPDLVDRVTDHLLGEQS